MGFDVGSSVDGLNEETKVGKVEETFVGLSVGLLEMGTDDGELDAYFEGGIVRYTVG